MKNNKGMTIVEIIVCLVLVSVMMIFLLNLLITVQNYNIQNQTTTDLLLNQAVIVKALEKDINEYKLVGVSNCNESDLATDRRYPVVPNNYSNLYCLKLIYDETLLDNNIGYLVQYTYTYKNMTTKNVVGYKRGSNQTVRESSIAMDSSIAIGRVTSSCSSNLYSHCSLKIVMPVIDEIGNNYNIVGTYIYDSSIFTYNKGQAYNFNIE